MRAVLGRENFKKLRAEMKAEAKALPNICWTCRKNENDLLAVGKKLGACTKCKGIGRLVWYCSK